MEIASFGWEKKKVISLVHKPSPSQAPSTPLRSPSSSPSPSECFETPIKNSV